MIAFLFATGCAPEDNNDNDVRVMTYMPQEITSYTVVCGGDVIVAQGLSLSSIGVCWSTEPNPTAEDSCYLSTTNWNEPFVCAVSGLEPSTKYYVRAFALRGLQYYYGEEKSFTTLEGELPTVITFDITLITAHSATSGGKVVSDGGLPVIERGICWSINPYPTIDDTHNSFGSGLGSFTVNMSGLEQNTTYHLRAYATSSFGTGYGEDKEFATCGTYNGHGYVDLGLPSGTLWATCNVGASKPEVYGGYFAWGETRPRSYFDDTRYRFYRCYASYDEDVCELTKYCNDSDYGYNGFTDDLTTLLPEDDAATVNWGGGARIPTEDDWVELYEHCEWSYVTCNGVKGAQFIGPSGFSLFLPAAGTRYYSDIFLYGGDGDYWSSSLNTGNPRLARIFYFRSGSYVMGCSSREAGLPIRAVRSSSQK